jgi:hypothetical protein
MEVSYKMKERKTFIFCILSANVFTALKGVFIYLINWKSSYFHPEVTLFSLVLKQAIVFLLHSVPEHGHFSWILCSPFLLARTGLTIHSPFRGLILPLFVSRRQLNWLHCYSTHFDPELYNWMTSIASRLQTYSVNSACLFPHNQLGNWTIRISFTLQVILCQVFQFYCRSESVFKGCDRFKIVFSSLYCHLDMYLNVTQYLLFKQQS